jgi:hypothetical protein
MKAARSQEARTSRVWKTSRPQESRIKRMTSNYTALFPSGRRRRKRERKERHQSLEHGEMERRK